MNSAPRKPAAVTHTYRADRLPPRSIPAETMRDIERVIARKTRKSVADLARERIARREA
jgi:hypothetical protein